MVKLLTQGGAEPTKETNNGKIPLQHAAAARHYVSNDKKEKIYTKFSSSHLSAVVYTYSEQMLMLFFQSVVSYLLKQKHNTYTLIEDRTFVSDLMQIAVANTPVPSVATPSYMAAQGGSAPVPSPNATRPITPRGRAGRVPVHLLPKVAEERGALVHGSGIRSMKILQEFVLVSPAPLETAAKVSRAFLLLSNRQKEQAKGLQECARYCEMLAVELLEICRYVESKYEYTQIVNQAKVSTTTTCSRLFI